MADIAVRGAPDNEEVFKEAEDYEGLVNQAEPLSMRPCRGEEEGWREEEGWLFALGARHWLRCTMQGIKQNLWISHAAEPIRGGMSAFRVEDDAKTPPRFVVLRH